MTGEQVIDPNSKHSVSVAVILLCAGLSARTGGASKNKLFSRFGSQTLLKHSTATATKSKAAATIVVTGAIHDAIRAELSGLDVMLVNNPLLSGLTFGYWQRELPWVVF